jgi:hypothetical protein
MAGFGVSGVEASGFVSREFVRYLIRPKRPRNLKTLRNQGTEISFFSHEKS